MFFRDNIFLQRSGTNGPKVLLCTSKEPQVRGTTVQLLLEQSTKFMTWPRCFGYVFLLVIYFLFHKNNKLDTHRGP